MFFRSFVRALQGTHEAVADINALGMVSMVGSAVPSLLLILALRRVSLPALAAIALTLTAAGITMYDGRSLTAHRTAIFVSTRCWCSAPQLYSQRLPLMRRPSPLGKPTLAIGAGQRNLPTTLDLSAGRCTYVAGRVNRCQTARLDASGLSYRATPAWLVT